MGLTKIMLDKKKANTLIYEIDSLFMRSKLTNNKKIEIMGKQLESMLVVNAAIEDNVNYNISDVVKFTKKYKNLIDELLSRKIREKHND